MEKITVITRFGGRWELLDRWRNSLTNQTEPPSRVLVVRDPVPESEGLEWELRLLDGEIAWELIENPSIGDPMAALRIGLDRADTEWVAFLDDDDHWEKNHLVSLRSCFSAGTRAICAAWSVVLEQVCAGGEIHRSGSELTESEMSEEERKGVPEIFSLSHLLEGGELPTSALCLEREMARSILAPEDFGGAAGDLWWKLALTRKASIAATGRTTVNVSRRLHSEGDRLANRLSHRRDQAWHGVQAAALSGAFGSLSPALVATASRRIEMRGRDRDLRRQERRRDEIAALVSWMREKKSFWVHSSEFPNESRRLRRERIRREKEKIGFPRHGLISRKNLSADAVLGVLDPGDTLTVDVFDTALHRRIAEPTDIFRLMAERVSAELGGISSAAYPRARIAAEKEARRRSSRDSGRIEVTFSEIFQVLASWLGWSEAKRDRAAELEWETEQSLMYPNPTALEFCRKAQSAGHAVWFLSDMYLPGDHVRTLLEKNGYRPDGVVVSGEIGVSKAEGALFLQAAAIGGWELARQVHVGDNVTSDVRKPASLGIRSLRFMDPTKRTPYADEVRWSAEAADDLPTKWTLGLARQEGRRAKSRRWPSRRHATAWKIGYEIAGPLTMGWMTWLHRQSRDLGLRGLYFLSRDGWLPSLAWERMRQCWGIEVEGRYTYGSRHLFERAALRELPDQLPFRLNNPVPGTTLRHAVGKFGLDWAEVEATARALQLPGPDDPLVDDRRRSLVGGWKGMLRSLVFALEQPILDAAARSRQQVLRYFEEIGFHRSDCAVVDAGWAGSVLRALANVTLDMATSPLQAFYFGSWDEADSLSQQGVELRSWFFHLAKLDPWTSLAPAPSRAQVVLECVPLIELMISAAEPTVVRFQESESGNLEPVFGPRDLTDEQSEIISIIHRGALAQIEDLLEVHPRCPETTQLDFYIEAALRRVFSLPTDAEAEVFGDIRFWEDTTGMGAPRFICPAPPSWPRRSLKQKYFSALWKKGYRARMRLRDQRRLPPIL